jgi:acyl transferase domain-containing protein/acyl carrier protein
MSFSEPIDDAWKTPGKSSLLKQALLAIQQTQAKLDAAEGRNSEPIAIVGAGMRFPGGVIDAQSFWNLLAEGRDAISLVPRDRWDVDAYFNPDPDAQGKMVTRWGGFLDRVDGFDARFFEIAPREAASMDPQQRLALEVAWETLENAGIAPASLHGTKTGVFLGIASSDYSQLAMETGDAELLDAHYASGVAHSIASGRISYLLGLEGPSVSLDTACSSSLVAVHLACQSLRAGDCTLALAGGVNLMLAPETTALLSRVRMLSPDGRCKAFDDKADGFVRGEGCGFVALKRLSEAQADGDRILAVIRGIAVNQDGASSSLTAPNGPSQVNLMRQALENGGVSPDQVSYIEAHGTGTALGDPIELQSLGAVYGSGRAKENLLAVGSLKTNVGHLEAAAGIAGLIKTVLALQHRQIPPSLHFERPTSHVRWEELRLRVPTNLIEWELTDAESGSARYAGVSSFGFSGTNAHVVIEEAPPPQMAREASAWPLQILSVSAKSATTLARAVGQYREYLENHRDADLRDFCFTANTGRSHFLHRACFLAPDIEAMKEQLDDFAAVAREEGGGLQRIGFLFTGQGSQYGGMGRELYASVPVFRSAMERCGAAYERERGEDLIATLYADSVKGNGGGEGMESARVAQAGLFALEYALAEMWRSWGIEPSVLLGHSLGEYVAAVVAGIFRVEDGMRLVCARARLMETLTEPGAMRSVSAPVERVRAAIAGHEKEVSIAAENGPESVVISGRAERVEEIAGKLEAAGVRTKALQVTHGFHSPLLQPILEEFERIAGEVEYRAPKIRILSNVTGKAARAEEMARPRYWREHMRSTVLFDAGLKAALETGCRTFIEVGPQPHLMTLGKSTHSSADIAWLPSMRKGRNAWLDILAAVQALYLQGSEIDWKALHGKSGRRLALPTYPFERERHWFRTKKVQPAHERSPHGHPLLGERVHSPLAKVQFESRIDSGHPAYLGYRIVAGQRIVPAAAYLEMALSAAAVFKEEPTLREIAFLRPCIFDEPRILQWVLDGKDDCGTFAIYSRSDRDIPDEWSLHATGKVSAEAEPHAGENVARVEIDAIRKRCTEEIAVSTFYGAFEESGAHVGPSLRTVTKIRRSATEALVEFDFVSEVRDDAALYRIHPVALDACFQAVVALLMNATGPAKAIYLPAALESLRIWGDPRKLAGAHAEIRGAQPDPGTQLTADVCGFDAAGNVLVHAKGLVLRPMQPSRDDSADTHSLVNAFYEVAWTPVHAATERDIRFQGTCVLAGDKTIARSFAASLQRSGACAVALPSDNVSVANAERNYDAEFSRIAQLCSAPISDFFYIVPHAPKNGLRSSADRLVELEANILGEPMRIAQALLRIEQKETPRLWIVTRGAQGPALTNVAQSALWGFGRAVAAEHSETRMVRIDLDPADEVNADALLCSLPTAVVEEELVLRGTEMYAPRLRPLPVTPEKLPNSRGIRRDGTYLVTGGMSGLGLVVAEWLAKCGAAQVIVMGRSPADAAALKSFEKMRDAGTIVSLLQGDVTNKANVQATFDLAKNIPLRGIFHCAGVLDDGALLHQNWERFERVLAPKIAGAWNLHRLSADLPLDHFVLFSSIASVFGSPGQTNYAAANAFLDGLAQYRHSQRLPALSINWGAWSETGAALRHGVLERQSKLGMKGISTRNGVAALERLIAGMHPQVAVAPMDWDKFLAVAGAETGRLFFSELKQRAAQTKDGRATQDIPSRMKNSSWMPQLRAANLTRRMDLLLRLLEERVQTTLGIHSSQAVDPSQPLQELGLDSLLSIELRNSLSASLECSLPATLLFNYPTLSTLAPFLLGQVLGEDTTDGRRNDSGDAVHALFTDLVRDIESMSDEEVDRLLNARTMEGAK